MPHYSDGTPAKLGDLVTGRPYNTLYDVTGVVVGIVPGADACNVRVAFARPAATRGESLPDSRRIEIRGYDPVVSTPQIIVVDVDYGEAKAFTRIPKMVAITVDNKPLAVPDRISGAMLRAAASLVAGAPLAQEINTSQGHHDSELPPDSWRDLAGGERFYTYSDDGTA